MSMFTSPQIVTNGLVFYLDSLNIKSYRGPAIQNLLTSINSTTGSSTGYSLIGFNEEVNIPELGSKIVTTVDIQNNYPSVSSWCCPNPIYYGGCTVSPSTLYTYGIVYKCQSGYTSPNYMYRYEYTSNGGTYVTEAGVHNDSNRVHLGNGWYYAWGTFTTQSTTNWLGGCASFYYRYSAGYDKLSVATIMIAQGNYAGMHPKYWPNINTTRSSAQAIATLVGSNTITADSLTYNANGSFSFNGSSNFISSSSSVTAKTVIAWCKLSTAAGGDYIVYGLDANGADNWFGINANRVYAYATQSSDVNNFSISGTTTIPTTNYCQIACTIDINTLKVFLNGVEEGSSTQAFTIGPWNATPVIGRRGSLAQRYFPGNIDSVAVYNRVLTPAEIKQHFNAQRGRYSL